MSDSSDSSSLAFVSRSERADVSPATVRAMERRVEVAIERGAAPGAVLLAARRGKIVESRAFGNRSVNPDVAMTPDTVFDLASLTKIVATATATSLLLEDGKLRLDDKVAAYIPEFAARGKDDVTLRDLLTHRSGLKAYEDVAAVERVSLAASPADNLVQYIAALPKLYPTGEFSVYSCLNYLTLARVNEIAAGESQESLLSRRVWKPLGMNDTGYVLGEAQKSRLAPTFAGSKWKPGMIHDPLANYHGVSAEHCPGNAGLFSTAHDLAIFCEMILGEGIYDGVRVMSPESVRRMISPLSELPEYDVAKKGAGPVERRGFGWIVYREKPYGCPEAPDGRFVGHTGYTGTYLWMDIQDRSFLILLANAVYASDPPQIQEYRKEITGAWLDGVYGNPGAR